MALFETWLTVDLMKGTRKTQIDDTFFYGDESANLVGVRVLSNGEPASLTGTCTGYVQRLDGSTVTVPGSVSGNTAYFIMRAACYAYPGPVNIAVTLTTNDTTTTLVGIRAKVSTSRTDTTIDPGSVIPSLDTLLARINEMQQATAAAQEVVDTYESRVSVAVVRSVNLYDSSKRELDKYCDPSNGVIRATAYNDRDVSELIDISGFDAGTTIKAQFWNTSAGAFGSGPISGHCFYDASENFLSGAGSGMAAGVQIPSGAKYLRLTIKKDTYSYAPMTTVIAPSDSFPTAYVGYWKLASEIATASDIYRVDGSAGATGVITTWAELATAAAAGGVWALGADIRHESTTGDITISHDFTLYGRGHRIHCNQSNTPLTITAGTVKFIGCDIYYAGNYMLLASGGSLWVSECYLHLAKKALVRGVGNAQVHVDHTEMAKSTGDDGFSLDEYARGFVSNCIIHECKDEGITTHSRSYCEVRDTEVYWCGYNMGGSGTIVLSQRGAASSFGGIHLGGSGMGIVTGCYCHDNLTYGIGLYHMASSYLGDKEICYGNRCEFNGYFIVDGSRVAATDEGAATAGLPISGGIMLSGCRDIDLACNTIMNNNGPGIAVGVDYFDPYRTDRTPACAGTIRSNYITGNTTNTPAVQTGADGGLTITDI